MPYLAFDLDAMARAEAAARSIGVADTLVKGGLLNLWAHCFKEKTDRVMVIQLAGFFGVVPIAAPLVAFGFLEEDGDAYRVKGADRYLRVVKGRREGGLKAAGNLKKGATKPGPSRDQAGEVSRLTPGLSPSTEHRAPNIIQEEEEAAPQNDWDGPEDFWNWFQSRRRAAGLVPEKPPNGKTLPDFWREALTELHGDPEPLREAVFRFSEDKYWQKRAPPCPFGGFVSQWRSFVPQGAVAHDA